jgi:hypothetical protein
LSLFTSKVGRIFVGETERHLPALKNDYWSALFAIRSISPIGEIDPWSQDSWFDFLLKLDCNGSIAKTGLIEPEIRHIQD